MRVRLLGLGLLCACPVAPGGAQDDAPAVAAASNLEPIADDDAGDPELAHAHEVALQRLHDAALPALAAFDPVAAAAIGKGELAPPPVSRGRRQVLREQMSAPRREAEGIDIEHLSPEAGMLLRTLEHGLERIDDELSGKTPLRVSPGAYLFRIEPLLEALEVTLSAGAAPRAPAVLSQLATELSQTSGQLGAASPSEATAAAEDAAATAARLRRLPQVAASPSPELTAAATEAADAAAALGRSLSEIAAALPDAPSAEWDAHLAPAPTGREVRRLPGRWGPEHLRRVLHSEAIVAEPTLLSAQLVSLVARLDAMHARGGDEARSAARPVTRERCAAAWAPILAWVGKQPPLAAATLDCDAATRRLAGRALDDASLQIELVHQGVVVPTREARRREVDPALALVGGRLAPAGHRRALTISVLGGAGLQGAAKKATADARDAACLAAAALAVHGEGGGGPDLVARIGAGCSHRDARQWEADVLARPEHALLGAGLLLLGDGPADALAMQRFWWAPLGLVGPLAQPPAPPPESPAPDVKIEPL